MAAVTTARLTLPGPLFGREGDLERLAARAEHPGVTFVTGRPLMGKTWLLTALGHRLITRSDFLVG